MSIARICHLSVQVVLYAKYKGQKGSDLGILCLLGWNNTQCLDVPISLKIMLA